MKEYKRKRLAEENCLDASANKVRKQLSSSERWRGKHQAEKEWEEFYNVDIGNLRWDMEVAESEKCWEDECLGPANRLAGTLERLGLGRYNLHDCTCENFDELSDEEILKRNGYL